MNRGIAAGFALLSWCSLASAQNLFVAPKAGQPRTAAASGSSGPVKRSRAVEIDRRVLADAMLDTRRPLDFNLFDDVSYRMSEKQVRASEDGTAVMITGLLDNQPHSSVAIGTNNDGFFALIQDEQGERFQVSQNGAQTIIEQVDTRGYPSDEHLEGAVNPNPRPALELPPGMVADNGTIIDVLLLWTPAVEARQGGASGTLLRFNTLLAQINQSFTTSGINTQLRWVAPQRINFNEAGRTMVSTLQQLQTNGDRIIDEVHTLRNTHRADLVAMITTQTEFCGVGYLLRPGVTEEWGFSLSNDNCAISNFTLAHEIGHNLGAHHDRFSANGQTGYFNYSFGWVTPQNPGFSDIMAYAPTGRPRRNHWATPTLTINGMIAGSAQANADSADLRTTINETRTVVAAFRLGGSQASGSGSSGSGSSGSGSSGSGSSSSGSNVTTTFGQSGDLVISGNWTGNGQRALGIYRPSTGVFILDWNNNQTFDSGTDRTVNAGGQSNDIPFVFTDPATNRDRPALFRAGSVIVPPAP